MSIVVMGVRGKLICLSYSKRMGRNLQKLVVVETIGPIETGPGNLGDRAPVGNLVLLLEVKN